MPQEYRKSYIKTDPLGTIAGDTPVMPSVPAYTPDTPLSPYFSIKIAGKIYDLSHDYLVSMTYMEGESLTGSMEFDIEDTMDLDLETKFMALLNKDGGEGQSSFQFGWQGLNVQDLSPWIPFIVTDYTPTFHPPHTMRIHVQCQCTSMKEDDIQTYKGNTWNDIVQQLCKREGWAIGEFDTADPPGEKLEMRQANTETLAFIRRNILPKCMCKGRPMVFYVDPTSGTPTAYFLSVEHAVGNPKEKFLIYAGKYSNVLTFSPSYSGKVMAAGAQEIGYIDEETGDVKIWKAGAGDSENARYEINVMNSTNKDYMEAMIMNKWYGRNVASYTATLKTVGSFKVKPTDTVDIIPFRIDGTPHYSAGNYFVQEVRHDIAGSFTTTYTLLRAQDAMSEFKAEESDENNTRTKSLEDGAEATTTTITEPPEAKLV